jgi:ankyrin repeat protein
MSSVEALWIIFRKLIQDADLDTVFCVLDGLDECDEDMSTVLIPKIVDLFSPGNSQPTTKLKLMIISRDIPGLQGSVQLKLDSDNKEQVVRDIDQFIFAKVEELSRIEGFDKEFRITVQETLLERSQGTFLWVGFVMYELSQKRTCVEVLETLQDLPRGLHAIYSRMLLQIESRHRRTSSRILRWVTMAARPLSLQELAAAVDIQSPALITRDRAVRDHVALCGLLLRVQEEEVSLIHQSARDYLLRKEPDSNPDLEEFRIKPEEAHLELTRTCFDCIAHSGLQYTLLDLDESCSQESPLLKYATLHWPQHARCCPTLAEELLGILKPFLQNDSGLRKNWWQSYRRADPWLSSNLPLLHVACYFGIVPWVRALLDRKTWIPRMRNLSAQDVQGWQALSYAAQEGHEAVVQLLVNRGANVDANDKDGRTALHEAASKGNEAMARLLLKYRADVNAKDKDGCTALHEAVSREYVPIVRLLLDYGADVNAKDTNGRTGLDKAVLRWHEGMVRLLVDRGADANWTDKDKGTLLGEAVSRGHRAVVRFLLECDANANWKDKYGGISLGEAASRGHKAVFQLLLNCSTDANWKDKDKRMALGEEVWRGHEGVLLLLLDRDANARGKELHNETLVGTLTGARGSSATANRLRRRSITRDSATASSSPVETSLNDRGVEKGYCSVSKSWLSPTENAFNLHPQGQIASTSSTAAISSSGKSRLFDSPGKTKQQGIHIPNYDHSAATSLSERERDDDDDGDDDDDDEAHEIQPNFGCKIYKFLLYESPTRFYFVSHDVLEQQKSRIFRVVHPKLAETQDIDILEDYMLYSEEEATMILNVLDDANKAYGGLKCKCLSWGLLGRMSSTGEYYMLVITKRSPVDVVEILQTVTLSSFQKGFSAY